MFNLIKLPIKTLAFRHYLINKHSKMVNVVRPFFQLNNCAQISFYNNNTYQTSDLLKRNNLLFLNVSRHYSKSRAKNYKQGNVKEDEDEDSEDEDEDEDDLDEDEKLNCAIKTVQSETLRIDKIIKSVLKFKVKHFEEMLYGNKFRINGNKITKKAMKVNVGDEIDIIRAVSETNPNLLTVTRLEIASIKVDKEKNLFCIKVKVFKSLLVENYDLNKTENA